MTRWGRCILAFLLTIAMPFAARGAAADEAPVEAPRSLHDIFQLRIEDKVLVLRTALDPASDEDPKMLPVRGFSAPAEVMNLRVGPQADGRAVVPGQFRLVVSDYETPGERSSLVVSWARGVLDVQRSTHYTGPRRYTRLVRLLVVGDRNVGVNQPPRGAQLMVTEAGGAGRPPVNVGVMAGDFAALLRLHPAAVNEHLRPLMRELGQESVFAPGARVAWQVFAEHWPTDEALKRKVEAILPDLDAADRVAREGAGERVARLGPDAALVLMQLDRRALSAEQNSRIDALIRKHAPLSRSAAVKLRKDVRFLLDCLNSDEPRVRAAALSSLRDACPEPIDFDADLPVPARGAAVAALREKLVPSEPAPGNEIRTPDYLDPNR